MSFLHLHDQRSSPNPPPVVSVWSGQLGDGGGWEKREGISALLCMRVAQREFVGG